MDSISEQELRIHVQILAWVQIAGAALMAIIGCFVLALLAGIGMVSGEAEAFTVLSIIGLFTAGLMVVLALPGLIAGIGLLQRKNWGRILAIVVGIFDLLSFPIGTLIAIYTFFVLFQNSATAYFAPDRTAISSPTETSVDVIPS